MACGAFGFSGRRAAHALLLLLEEAAQAGRKIVEAALAVVVVGTVELLLDADGDDGGLHLLDHVGEGGKLALDARELDRLGESGMIELQRAIGEAGRQADAEGGRSGEQGAALQDGPRIGIGGRHGGNLETIGRAAPARDDDHDGWRLTPASPEDDVFVR